MAFNFRAAAQKAVSLCPLMTDREKLSTSEIINKDLTIVAFDFAPKYDQKTGQVVCTADGEVDTYGVVIFQELPHSYYTCGTIPTKVCHVWADEFDGDVEEASNALAESGGVKVRFIPTKTKSGNTMTNMIIL